MSKKLTMAVIFSILLFIFGSYSYLIEPNILKAEPQAFELSCLSGDVSEERFVHISDLHFHSRTPQGKINKIGEAIERINPYAVFITGDLISKEDGVEQVVNFVNKISQKYPTYIVFGNWDYFALNSDISGFKNELEKAGANVLINEMADMEVKGEVINIIGVRDPATSRDVKRDMEESIEEMKDQSGGCKILLAHTPDIVKEKLVSKFDLILAGHTHGGQVYIPFITDHIILEMVGGKGFTRGYFKVGETQMYVNRGLGTGLFPFRFLAFPEITVITFEKPK